MSNRGAVAFVAGLGAGYLHGQNKKKDEEERLRRLRIEEQNAEYIRQQRELDDQVRKAAGAAIAGQDNSSGAENVDLGSEQDYMLARQNEGLGVVVPRTRDQPLADRMMRAGEAVAAIDPAKAGGYISAASGLRDVDWQGKQRGRTEAGWKREDDLEFAIEAAQGLTGKDRESAELDAMRRHSSPEKALAYEGAIQQRSMNNLKLRAEELDASFKEAMTGGLDNLVKWYDGVDDGMTAKLRRNKDGSVVIERYDQNTGKLVQEAPFKNDFEAMIQIASRNSPENMMKLAELELRRQQHAETARHNRASEGIDSIKANNTGREKSSEYRQLVSDALTKVLQPRYGGKMEGGVWFPDEQNRDVALRAQELTAQNIQRGMDHVAAASAAAQQAEREQAERRLPIGVAPGTRAPAPAGKIPTPWR